MINENAEFIMQISEKKYYEISIYIVIVGIIFLILMLYAFYQLIRLRRLSKLIKNGMFAISVVYALPDRQNAVFILWVVLCFILLIINIWLFIKRLKLKKTMKTDNGNYENENANN